MRFGRYEKRVIFLLQKNKEMTIKSITNEMFKESSIDEERRIMRVIRALEKKQVVQTRFEKNLSSRKNDQNTFIYRKLVSLR